MAGTGIPYTIRAVRYCRVACHARATRCPVLTYSVQERTTVSGSGLRSGGVWRVYLYPSGTTRPVTWPVVDT
eukprot:2146355-Rhodomonas_salina.2